MKRLLKNITPPALYSLLRKLRPAPRLAPVWNTLAYEPVRGVKMFFDPAGAWQKKMLDGSYDKALFDEARKMNLEAKTVFDVGAHIGFHSLYFSRLVGPRGRVIAFEPNPKNVERLTMNRDANPDIKDRVTILDIAASDAVGTAEFTMNEDIESGRSSGGYIGGARPIWGAEAFKQRGFLKMKAKTLPLDSLPTLGIDAKPDLIKIDVEGAEGLVLKGAEKLLRTSKPALLMEVHSMPAMLDAVSFLSKLSYDMSIFSTEPDGRCLVKAVYRP